MTYEPFIAAQPHVDFLKENNIFFHPSGTYPPGWFKPGLRYRGLFDLWVEPWSDHRSGPTFSALGAFSYSRSCFGPDATIGRYCAIGENVAVMSPNHPTDRVAMCGFDYARPAPFGSYADHRGIEFPVVPLPDETFVGGVEIGPDVWIGSGALIARGVKIGTGAIVAANAVVTRDVEPYTLVAGNPARAKRRRFPDALCERLLASEWWRYPFDAFVGMDTTDPERFLDQLGEAEAAGTVTPMPEARINIHAAFREITARVRIEEEAAKASAAQAEKTAAEEAARRATEKAEAEARARAELESRATSAETAAQTAEAERDAALGRAKAAEEAAAEAARQAAQAEAWARTAEARLRVATTAAEQGEEARAALTARAEALAERAEALAGSLAQAETEIERLRRYEAAYRGRVDVRLRRGLRRALGG